MLFIAATAKDKQQYSQGNHGYMMATDMLDKIWESNMFVDLLQIQFVIQILYL